MPALDKLKSLIRGKSQAKSQSAKASKKLEKQSTVRSTAKKPESIRSGSYSESDSDHGQRHRNVEEVRPPQQGSGPTDGLTTVLHSQYWIPARGVQLTMARDAQNHTMNRPFAMDMALPQLLQPLSTRRKPNTTSTRMIIVTPAHLPLRLRCTTPAPDAAQFLRMYLGPNPSRSKLPPHPQHLLISPISSSPLQSMRTTKRRNGHQFLLLSAKTAPNLTSKACMGRSG